MADGLVFPAGRQHLDDAELVADGLILGVGQHQPDPVIARRVAGRPAAGLIRQVPSIFRWVWTVSRRQP